MKKKREITESKYPPVNNEDLWLKDGKLYHSTSQGWVPLSEEPSITETYEQGVSSISYSGKDGQEHLIELSENVESDVTDIINDTFVTDEDNNITFTDDNDTEHTLVTTDALPSILANNNMQEVTWLQLKNLRDNSQLTPGSLYRITDYNCTTTQENTRSAGHQFDIVLLALSEDKLAEEGWAMMHDNIYDVTFADGVTKKCYVYEASQGSYNIVDVSTLLGTEGIDETITIDEENKIVTITGQEYVSSLLTDENVPYNYFQNSNLSAWKIWYSLDNNKARFSWADDSVDEGTPSQISVRYGGRGGIPIKYATCIRNSQYDTVVSDINYYCFKADGYLNKVYTRTETPSVDDSVFTMSGGGAPPSTLGTVESYTPSQQGTGPNGRGVIYRLIDEWNNDVPYDFKNIMCTLTLDDGGQYDEEGNITYVYTFDVFDIDSNSHKDMSVTIDADTNKVLVQNVQWKQNMDNENEDNVPLLSLNIFYKWNFGDFINLDLNTSFNNIFLAPINNVTAGKLWDCVFEDMTSCTFGYGCNSLTLRGAAYDLNYGNSGIELATKDDLN